MTFGIKVIHLIKVCPICGKEFTVPYSLRRVRFCSYKCSYIGLREYRSEHLKKNRWDKGFPKGKKNIGAQKWWKENNPMKLEKNKEKMRGENNHNWRGGVSFEVYGKEWEEIRQLVLERDNFTCQECGLTHHETILNVHHKNPWRLSHDNSLENLITLCRKCHANITWRIETKLFIKLKGGD